MKVLIFGFLAAVTLCLNQRNRYFKFEDGTFERTGASKTPISGSFHILEDSGKRIGMFAGLDRATMLPFVAAVESSVNGSDTRFSGTGLWRNTRLGSMWGNVTLDESGGSMKLYGDFVNDEYGTSFAYRALLKESSRMFYTPKEAGRRAKSILGQNSEYFDAANVVAYAISDIAYFLRGCSMFLGETWPDAPGPEPGAIIVGSDGKHCGILDDEGTKFVHNNPVSNIATYESLAVVERYFPKGVIYKRYADTFDGKHLYQDHFLKEQS